MSIPREIEHLEQLTNLGPIAHDFSDLERAVARAGYDAYHQGRTVRPWANLNGAEQFRWCLAATLLCQAGTDITSRTLRACYHLHTTQPPWTEVSDDTRGRWARVVIAMRRAIAAFEGVERMVVSG